MRPAALAVQPLESTPEVEAARASLRQAFEWTGQVVLGKPQVIRFAYACLLAGGHLLLDDRPGVGKTTLARTLARAMGLTFQRIQFTSDLLPADILGVSVFDSVHQEFRFHPGPVFTHLLLADEINRASPRTQSALLEAMAEHQVTVDGQTHSLSTPFFVMATQNPVDLAGTFPLPDSQLDRFLVRLELGYPDAESELQLLRQDGVDQLPPPPITLRQSLGPEELVLLQKAIQGVHITEPVLAYILALVTTSREHPSIQVGLSPRAGLALARLARAWAFLDQRAFVTPEDVQEVFPAVAGHRLVPRQALDEAARRLLPTLILQDVAIPG